VSNELVEALVNMREQDAIQLAQQMLDEGTDAKQILGFIRKAMDVVGRRFEDGEYFLPELILSGEMVQQISEIVKPRLSESADTNLYGRVLIGTVQGDIHDIGKNLVTFMLDVNGFEVLDLGIDVPPQQFVDAIQTFMPQVVALSGFLTLAYDSMKKTVDAIEAIVSQDDVKIMIGGGQINDKIREYVGAHAYGKDAMSAVRLAQGWIGGA